MQAARGTAITTAGSSAEVARPVSRVRLRLLYATVALLGLATDVVSKIIAVDRLDPARPVRLLDGLLTLRLIRNPGAAFSAGVGFTWVFAIAAALVLVFVVVRLAPRIGHTGWAVALGLLTAGVSGNLSDRIFRTPGVLRGHVVDFLQLPHWPIFNVADMCICGAAGSILVLAVIKNVGIGGERYTKTPAASEADTSVDAAEGPAEGADPDRTTQPDPDRTTQPDPDRRTQPHPAGPADPAGRTGA